MFFFFNCLIIYLNIYVPRNIKHGIKYDYRAVIDGLFATLINTLLQTVIVGFKMNITRGRMVEWHKLNKVCRNI